MMKKLLQKLFVFVVWLFSWHNTYAQVTFSVSVPNNTPNTDDIYIAGTFNNWNPQKDKLLKNSDGTFSLTLNVAPGTYEYKYTRGSWANVEGSANGTFVPNRKINVGNLPQTVKDIILGWENNTPKTHTAAENVKVVKEDFYIPQLNRSRKISIYLPKDYYTNTQQHYKVMYMQDGQNIFDEYYAFGKEWKIDETLNLLFDNAKDNGCIVVGIDNGGANRINEYTPYTNAKYGGGEGDLYVNFIVQTLKPYIDANYRTLPQREFTGIGGSSLGGLISFYAAMKHQNTFGKALIFSPSFWWNSAIYDLVSQQGKQHTQKIFLMAGGEEEPDDDVVIKAQSMFSTLQTAGYTTDEITFVTHEDGTHSEWYWAREFGNAYQWLWNSTLSAKTPNATTFKLFPNPAKDILHIALPPDVADLTFEIKDTLQKVLLKGKVSANESINIASIPNGHYALFLLKDNTVIASQAFIVQR